MSEEEGGGGASFLVSYKVSDVDRNQVNENKRELPAGILIFSFNAYHVDVGSVFSLSNSVTFLVNLLSFTDLITEISFDKSVT